MAILDAEYQFDHHKLVYFFEADRYQLCLLLYVCECVFVSFGECVCLSLRMFGEYVCESDLLASECSSPPTLSYHIATTTAPVD